jgi:anti-anti-sigma factor
MAAHLSLDISGDTHGIVVRAIGPLDGSTKSLLDEALTQLSIEPIHLRIDLRGVTSINDAGLEVLLALSTRCRANGGTLSLVSPSHDVLAVMQTHRVQEEDELHERKSEPRA